MQRKGVSMEPLLTVEECAELLRVKVATVRRWCREGRIRAIHPGRAWRIPREALEELMQRPPAADTPEDPAQEPESLGILEELRMGGFLPNDGAGPE